MVVIVNVASKCGLTDGGYKELVEFDEKYRDQGLQILAFPCNQFGYQEPGGKDEICEFTSKKYNVKFPIFAKIDVNGSNTHPLFEYLKEEQKGVLGTTSIKWNFNKFVVDRDGKVTHRIAPTSTLKSIEPEIQKMLAAKPISKQ